MANCRWMALALTLLSLATLRAQTGAGRIQGTAKDRSGAVLPNLKVVATHIETGNAFRTQSNEIGFFMFPRLQPGRYRIAAEAPGLEKWEAELQLQAGQEAVIEPVLAVAAAATQITVVADVTPLVTTTGPTLANVVERQRIEQLPLNGRSFQNLLMITTPGLEGSSSSPQAFGLRDGTMEFLQDGVSINDANIGSVTTRPPGLDTIQEYRVETSVSSARNARPATTVVSTRAGTNEFHGSVFYTGRNNGFGVARRRQDFYLKPPQLIRNEFGASAGGPVVLPHVYNGKNRTFAFVAWEELRLRSSSTISNRMPTLAMRQGDFSRLQDAQGRAIALYDPWSTAAEAQSWRRTPYAGNIIPLTLRSPLATHLYSVTPAPTHPEVNPAVAANWFGPEPTTQDDYTVTARIDHRLRNQDQIYGRYTTGVRNGSQRRQTGTNNTPITLDKLWNYVTTPETMRSVMGSWNHIFSPTFFVETVVAGSQMYWRYSLDSPGAQEDVATRLGVQNPINRYGAPNITNAGFNLTYTGALPRSQDTKPLSGEQSYTLVRGKHQFEFGWRVRHQRLDLLPDRNPQSAINFASQATGLYDPSTGNAAGATPRTGDNAANFFLGIAGQYAQTRSVGSLDLRATELTGYVQDNWKVSPDLTVNLGLRYEHLPPIIDRNGTHAVFDFSSRSIVRRVSVDELVQAGHTTREVVQAYEKIGVKFATTQAVGLPDSLVNVGQLNFSPRAGLAYRRRVGGRSVVVRGGFGVYRFPLPARTVNLQRTNAPLQATFQYNLNAAAQSPDGRANYALRSVPAVIAGVSSANVINPQSPTAIGVGVAPTTFDSSLPTALAREWNITLEAEIVRNTRFRASYIGTQGRNLEQAQDFNGQPNNYIWYVLTGQALPTGTYANVARRSFDQTTYGDITVYRKTGYSNYNGFHLEVERRFTSGLAFQWFYVMSNALWTGSGGETLSDISVPDPATFFPGAVPLDYDARNRFFNYCRNTDIPKHRVRWNFLFDLPFGRGKKWVSHADGVLDRIVGRWQLAAYSSMNSRYFSLPTDNWGPLRNVEVYGTKYPIQDCRSGTCIPGYLYYNGYIPANRINTYDAQGRPNGVMGVPQEYRPSHSPITPILADGGSPADPNFALYDSNLVYVTLKNGAQQRVAYDTGLHPWRNQFVPGPWAWTVNASLFKTIPLRERLRLRLNMDFFNALNMPGMQLPNSSTGILSLQNSQAQARQLQWTLRLNW